MSGSLPLGVPWKLYPFQRRLLADRARTRVVLKSCQIGAGAPDENLLGEANRLDGLAGTEVCAPFGCGSHYRLRPALSARWDGASTMAADPAVAFTLDDRDTTEVASVAFRVASRDVPLNAGRAFQELRLVLVDADGAAAGVDLGELPTTQPIPHVYPATSPFELLQTVRVPVAAIEGIDPTRLSGVEVTPTAPSGALLITDVALEPRHSLSSGHRAGPHRS